MTTPAYKIKPPKEGEGEGCLKLPRWQVVMKDWLVVQKLWSVMELPADHDYTLAQLEKSCEARFIILSQLSDVRRTMVSGHEKASEVWAHLVKV